MKWTEWWWKVNSVVVQIDWDRRLKVWWLFKTTGTDDVMFGGCSKWLRQMMQNLVATKGTENSSKTKSMSKIHISFRLKKKFMFADDTKIESTLEVRGFPVYVLRMQCYNLCNQAELSWHRKAVCNVSAVCKDRWFVLERTISQCQYANTARTKRRWTMSVPKTSDNVAGDICVRTHQTDVG